MNNLSSRGPLPCWILWKVTLKVLSFYFSSLILVLVKMTELIHFFLILGPNPAVLRAYSCLCTQKYSWQAWRSYEMPGSKCGLAFGCLPCKPAVLLMLRPLNRSTFVSANPSPFLKWEFQWRNPRDVEIFSTRGLSSISSAHFTGRKVDPDKFSDLARRAGGK